MTYKVFLYLPVPGEDPLVTARREVEYGDRLSDAARERNKLIFSALNKFNTKLSWIGSDVEAEITDDESGITIELWNMCGYVGVLNWNNSEADRTFSLVSEYLKIIYKTTDFRAYDRYSNDLIDPETYFNFSPDMYLIGSYAIVREGKKSRWSFVFVLFAVCGLTVFLLKPLVSTNHNSLVLVIVFIICIFLYARGEVLRYKLRKRVEKLPLKERLILSEFDSEVRYAIPAAGSASPIITTLVGFFAVNGPLVFLMVGPLVLLKNAVSVEYPIALIGSLLLGFALAWVWWLVGGGVWQCWATSRRGMPPNEVLWRGKAASILRHRHNFLERKLLWVLFSRHRAR
jgi:hypothetical protein